MCEGVGQGVGVGRRAILVFFGFSIFFWRAALWLGRFLCWCVCEKGGCPPGVRVVWRCRCEAGVHCVACLWWTWSCYVREMWWQAQAGRGRGLEHS